MTDMTEKRLWHVTIEGECYVWAASEGEAEDEAKHALSSYDAQEAGLDSFWASPVDASDIGSVSEDWLDSIPFGYPPDGFTDMSVEEALETLGPPPTEDVHPDQLPLPLAVTLDGDRPVSSDYLPGGDEDDDPDGADDDE